MLCDFLRKREKACEEGNGLQNSNGKILAVVQDCDVSN